MKPFDQLTYSGKRARLNPEKARAWSRNWRAANIEKARQLSREYLAKWRKTHPLEHAARQRQWRVQNRLAHLRIQARSRVKRKNAEIRESIINVRPGGARDRTFASPIKREVLSLRDKGYDVASIIIHTELPATTVLAILNQASPAT